MYDALIVTPVKDSIETTTLTIEAIKSYSVNCLFYIYNDFSSTDNTAKLKDICKKKDIHMVNLDDHTNHPSPNYRLILQLAQKMALSHEIPLIIVESDVVINKNTIKDLLDHSKKLENVGLLGFITKNTEERTNFPYIKYRTVTDPVIRTKHRVSFCCTLLSKSFLKVYDFNFLEPNKHWYDVAISRKSQELGFTNYLINKDKVLHTPHSSRPWKLLKYENPVKYYLTKFWKRRDKI